MTVSTNRLTAVNGHPERGGRWWLYVDGEYHSAHTRLYPLTTYVRQARAMGVHAVILDSQAPITLRLDKRNRDRQGTSTKGEA